MKLHIVTIGEPKLAYAKSGWQEYCSRLKHYHDLRITHLSNKYAYDAQKIIQASENSYRIVLEITGHQLSSIELAAQLRTWGQNNHEVCFIIGGPEGLPKEVVGKADYCWSLSSLTFPHDLAMLITAETLYRSSTININHPYHK